jgi:GNAT superfamily N-acetyltransferase
VFNINKIVEYENSFCGNFTNVEKRPFGRLFYNTHNPDSHDSNHAIIENLETDILKALRDIREFYQEKGISPRIYQAFMPGEIEIIRPFLGEEGFSFQVLDSRFFYLKETSKINPRQDIFVRRITSIDEDIIDLVHSEDEGDWTIGVLKRHIKHDRFHLLGAWHNNKLVSILSLNIMEGLSRVDDVITHKDYRGKGFSSALFDHSIGYHKALSNNDIYLWASNPDAIKVYEKGGFVEFDLGFRTWSAYV